MEMLSCFPTPVFFLLITHISSLISLPAIKPHLLITQAVRLLQRLPLNKLLVTFALDNNCGRWPFCK